MPLTVGVRFFLRRSIARTMPENHVDPQGAGDVDPEVATPLDHADPLRGRQDNGPPRLRIAGGFEADHGGIEDEFSVGVLEIDAHRLVHADVDRVGFAGGMAVFDVQPVAPEVGHDHFGHVPLVFRQIRHDGR